MSRKAKETLSQAYPDLIKDSSKIKNIQQGWIPLLSIFCQAVREHLQNSTESTSIEIELIVQVRGELVILASDADTFVYQLIKRTQREAKLACEMDGAPAIDLFVCTPHWYRHLCKSCAELYDCMTYDNLHENIAFSEKKVIA